MSEKILPRPVVRDRNGKMIKKHNVKDFFFRVIEELLEATEEYNKLKTWQNANVHNHKEISEEYREKFAEEVCDIITVCVSMLEANGIDEEKRSKIFRQVNEKNEKRGYFEEV